MIEVLVLGRGQLIRMVDIISGSGIILYQRRG